MTAFPQRPTRLYFLDWARIGAFALLVLFHVGMYYVSWGWHIKSPYASTALEPWMRLSEPWRMGLIFVVSGAATSFMLAGRGGRPDWLADRSRRLLLPLLCGMVLVVPPQSYFQVVEKFAYAGGYADFLGLYFRGFKGFCDAEGCLVLPTWNHLWFLPYLWVYTVIVWSIERLRPGSLDRMANLIARAFTGLGLWLVPITLLALARMALLTRFGSTHALVDDWHNHVVYGMLFALGLGLARGPALFDRLAAGRWASLALAIGAWGLLNLYYAAFDAAQPPPEWLRLAQRCVHAAMQWSAIAAVLGFARRHLNVDHRWRAPLNEAVFPCYILHQTLIVLAAVALRPLHWPPSVEGPLLVVITFGGSVLGWRLLRRSTLMRPWFGLPSKASGRPALA